MNDLRQPLQKRFFAGFAWSVLAHNMVVILPEEVSWEWNLRPRCTQKHGKSLPVLLARLDSGG